MKRELAAFIGHIQALIPHELKDQLNFRISNNQLLIVAAVTSGQKETLIPIVSPLQASRHLLSSPPSHEWHQPGETTKTRSHKRTSRTNISAATTTSTHPPWRSAGYLFTVYIQAFPGVQVRWQLMSQDWLSIC